MFTLSLSTSSLSMLTSFASSFSAENTSGRPDSCSHPSRFDRYLLQLSFMRLISQNNLNWSGQGGSLVQYIGGDIVDVYAFDIFRTKADDRGDTMYPGNWKTILPCSERNAAGVLIQPPVMPGPWGSTLRETIHPLQLNEIEADYKVYRQTGERTLPQRCGRYYTCEEWPPRRHYFPCLTYALKTLIS